MSGHQANQFEHSQITYKCLLDEVVQPGTRWLDVGCGHTIIADWFKDCIPFQHQLLSRCEFARGCDPVDDRPHVAGLEKYVGDCTTLPWADGTFSLATANMVVEHLDKPAVFLKEIHRVLAPGGRFVFHTPNLHHPMMFMANLVPSSVVKHLASSFDGRSYDDIFPTHYRLNTRRSISSVEGFTIERMSCVPTQLFSRVPVMRSIENWFIGNDAHRRFKNLQADWIVILQKPSESTR